MDGLLALPSHLCERLASALESGLVSTSASAAALQSVLGSSDPNSGVPADLAKLAEMGVSGAAAASWIRSLVKAGARGPRADLVWSGPEVPGLFARDTKRVFQELIEAAQRSLLLSTYVYFDGRKAFATVARRMEVAPNLEVTLLLNIQRKRGDTTDAKHLVRQFADQLWRKDWPGTRRPQVFYNPNSLEPDGPSGVLHAKAAVADDETVFITSANLTEAALERNIELGVLLRDRALAATVSTHFRALIDHQLLRPLPGD